MTASRAPLWCVVLAVLTTACDPPDADGDVWSLDFDDTPIGPYDATRLAADWRDPAWSDGIDEGRVEIVGDDDAHAGRSLRVHYPAGGYGPDDSGAQWTLALEAPHTELYCGYRVRFADGFEFVHGGKLPGLAGGTANTGGDRPDGSDGWSARMMWRDGGAAVQYVYHPDQAEAWGDDLAWIEGGERRFVPGRWHRVQHRVRMNQPGQHDGLIEGWLDGELDLHRDDLRFRDLDSIGIDALLFSTFFGGDDPSWAAARDEVVDFDEFWLGPEPLYPGSAS